MMTKFSATVLLSCALLVSEAAASSLVMRTSSSMGVLFARQTGGALDPSSIPTQCTSQCTPIVTSLNSCTTDSCLCTSTNGRSLESCMNCVVALVPTAAMISQAKEVLDTFETECSAFSVPSLTLTATGSSGSASAGSASASAGVSASAPGSGVTGTASAGVSSVIGGFSSGFSSVSSGFSSGFASASPTDNTFSFSTPTPTSTDDDADETDSETDSAAASETGKDANPLGSSSGGSLGFQTGMGMASAMVVMLGAVMTLL